MSQLSQYVQKWLAGDLELAPITALLGVRPVSLGEGEAKIELTASERLHNAMRTVHGGIFCDLADVAMGAALAAVTADGESFSTLQLQMSYFLPVVERPSHRPGPRDLPGAYHCPPRMRPRGWRGAVGCAGHVGVCDPATATGIESWLTVFHTTSS